MDFDLSGNVLVDGEEITGVVDFDDACLSPCAACLGYALRDVLFCAGAQRMRDYVAAYEVVRPLRNSEAQIWQNALLFRNYFLTTVTMGAPDWSDIIHRSVEVEQEMFALFGAPIGLRC